MSTQTSRCSASSQTGPSPITLCVSATSSTGDESTDIRLVIPDQVPRPCSDLFRRGREKSCIRLQPEHDKAELVPLCSDLWRPAHDPCGDAIGERGPGDRLDQTAMFGVASLIARVEPRGDRQVVGADEDGIYARHR